MITEEDYRKLHKIFDENTKLVHYKHYSLKEAEKNSIKQEKRNIY
jgi:hypothetical protein